MFNKKISKAKTISLTTDACTSKRQKIGFLGITAHFFNNDLISESACICSRQLKDSHKAAVLAELIYSVMLE